MGGQVVNTSVWSLVVHRVSQYSVEIWVGTLFPHLEKPTRAVVELRSRDGSQLLQSQEFTDWERPFSNYQKGFFKLVAFEGLNPNQRYTATWRRYSESVKEIPGLESGWQQVGDGIFDTLPSRLPAHDKIPFTIGLASCYYYHRDGGQPAASYRALYDRGDPKYQPNITFLTGDQVYLDIGLDSISGNANETIARIAHSLASANMS